MTDMILLRAPEYADANAPGIRALQIARNTPFDEVATILRAAFTGTKVRPDFSKELGAAAVHHAIKHRDEKARAFQWLVLELFPASVKGLVAAGETELLLAPDADMGFGAALPLYEKAALAVDGAAMLSPVRLRYRASQFSKLGFPKAALGLARVAAELHRDDVKTLDSAASRETKAKHFDRARMYLEQAEAISPSKKRLKTLTNLRKRLAAGLVADPWDAGADVEE